MRLLHGVPLIGYTIRAAQAASKLTYFVVSTEDEEIKQVALSYGADVVDRPMALAGDDITTGAVLRNALDVAQGNGPPYDYVVCLHPTSPIRDPKHIDKAIELIFTLNAQALASVACRKRTYTHNASIYIVRADWLRKTNQHYCDSSVPFLMDAPHSVDIDTEDDFRIAELYLNGHNGSTRQ